MRRYKKQDDKSLLAYSLRHIIIKNVCTVFNLLCLILAVPLFLVHSYKNLLYLGTVAANLAIGIFQEYRAKLTVERMSLKIEPRVTIVRGDAAMSVRAEEVCCGDLCVFAAGQQVAVDCTVKRGAVEANESLITGESMPVLRQRGDALNAGAIVVSGQCEAEANCDGGGEYLRSIEEAVKQYRAPLSLLMRDLRRLSAISGLAVLPVGILLFLTEFTDFGVQSAVVHASAAMLSVMPLGLMLLSSVSLAVGVLRLSKKAALTRDLYCIEALARVNVLCVDKTGTLTDGNLTVAEAFDIDTDKLTPLSDATHERLCNFVLAMPRDNATARALAETFNCGTTEEPAEIVPFSSARKRTEMRFASGLYAIGAPDWVLPELPNWLHAHMDEFAEQGLRVLLFAKDERATALIVLKDSIRENVGETLSFFKRENVDICLMSGDYEKTVRAVARKLALGSEVLDCSALETPEDYAGAAAKYRLFARVTPDKKALLIEAMQKKGLCVAMVGDGVNDLPALKRADCAIAMASGADAPKHVAQLVLLNDDFATLPHALLEGRRVVKKIQRSAQLYMKKSIFSFALALLTLCFSISYPFENIQWTIIGFFTVGLPSVVLALEPCNELFIGDFIKSVLARAVPGALLNLILVLAARFILPALGVSATQTQTMVIWLTAICGMTILISICRPFNTMRRWLCVAMGLLLAASLIVLRGMLEIGVPDLWSGFLLLVCALVAYPLFVLLSRVCERVFMRRSQRSRSTL
ncbi:MAG: HAD-IC family P-type ATPase [Clostridiales bacterium]|nr:HAD-IC family P-type ATPase [Clostridiales bacterium]